jgi:RNA polymerase sigma-70 factor (ECF subfamily)
LRRGCPDAYETFVRTAGPRALAVARRFLRQDQEAQDAVQEAFLAAFKALPSFAGESQLSTWFHRIVVNACLMRIRARATHPEESIEGLLPSFLEDGHHCRPPGPWPEPADLLVLRAEVRAFVRASIDRLPESYRTVLLLRDIEELDTAETAKLLGISEGAVKVRLHRAHQALRGLLEPCLGRETS